MNTTANSRQRRRRLGILAAATVAAALALTGCTSAKSGGAAPAGLGGDKSSESAKAISKIVSGKTIKIGFSPPILSEYYTQIQKAAWNEMNRLSSLYGVKWTWSRQSPLNDAHSGSGTASIIQGYISRKFDVVFVSSAAPGPTMQALYKEGRAKGVDFYQFNSTEELQQKDQANDRTGGMNSISNIGYDDRWQSGYVAGRYIAEKLNGKGKVIAILGPSGSDWTKLRIQGFRAAIAENPGMKLIGEADGGYVRDKGLSAAQALLTKNRDVNAIWGENEDMALGASAAVEAAGLKNWDGKSGVITVGADGLVSGMEAIKQGKLTATVDTNTTAIGTQMIDTMFQSTLLKQDVSEFIRVPTGIVDKTNVAWHEGVMKDSLAGPGKY